MSPTVTPLAALLLQLTGSVRVTPMANDSLATNQRALTSVPEKRQQFWRTLYLCCRKQK